MSSSELQECLQLLQEIDTLLNGTIARVDKLEVEGDKVAREMITVQQFERILYRLSATLKLMGLGTQVTTVLQRLSRLIMAARMATMSLHYLQSSVPVYGWLMMAMGGVTAAYMGGEAATEFLDTRSYLEGY